MGCSPIKVAREAKAQKKFGQGEYSINPFSMQTVTSKPNHITPKQPYQKTKVDDLADDRVERAFRLDAMRRKIVTAGMVPRQRATKPMTSA